MCVGGGDICFNFRLLLVLGGGEIYACSLLIIYWNFMAKVWFWNFIFFRVCCRQVCVCVSNLWNLREKKTQTKDSGYSFTAHGVSVEAGPTFYRSGCVIFLRPLLP